MTYQIHRFSNGVRLVHRETSGPVAHLGLLVNTGSRDDPFRLQGIAHFIEHMLFKGTVRRTATQVINRLENIGSDVNAFTTKEDTCLYASFLKNYYQRALESFSDILYGSVFPETEVEKERAVVMDEINSYKDSPAEWIHDAFEEMIFPGHPLGRNILGTRKSIKNFSHDVLSEYLKENHHCSEIVISSVGAISFQSLVKMVSGYFARRHCGLKEKKHEVLPEYKPQISERKFSRHQAHMVIGSTAYSSRDEKRFAMALVSNLLGGPAMNSRLSNTLREKHGIAYNVESNYHAFSDTGLFEIYLGTGLEMIDKSIDLVHKELRKLTNHALGTAQLHTAKEQLKGQIAIASESQQAEMLALGRQVLLFDRAETLDEIMKRVDDITAQDILTVANEVLDPERLSRLVFRY